MSRKSKGTNAERELIHLFWKNNWTAVRVAGSGSNKYPSPDIVAGTLTRKLAIECKSSSQKAIYLNEEDISQLIAFSRLFGAEAWFGARFNTKEWFFLSIDDLNKTKEGYSIDLELLKNKGLLFEELIG